MSKTKGNINERPQRDRIDEMIRGYNNAQELIRFMDSKLAVIWGFCTAILAVCASSGIELYKKIEPNVISMRSLLIIVLLLVFIITSGIAFWATVNGIYGRKEQGVTTPLPHILFPIGNNFDIHQFKVKVAQRSEEDEYNEVCDQIYSVGKILEIKIIRSRLASNCLYGQIAATVIIFILDKL